MIGPAAGFPDPGKCPLHLEPRRSAGGVLLFGGGGAINEPGVALAVKALHLGREGTAISRPKKLRKLRTLGVFNNATKWCWLFQCSRFALGRSSQGSCCKFLCQVVKLTACTWIGGPLCGIAGLCRQNKQV
jgi:hypothetical protein